MAQDTALMKIISATISVLYKKGSFPFSTLAKHPPQQQHYRSLASALNNEKLSASAIIFWIIMSGRTGKTFSVKENLTGSESKLPNKLRTRLGLNGIIDGY